MSHNSNYSRILAPLKVARKKEPRENRGKPPLKNGNISAQCASGACWNCASIECRHRAKGCGCRFNVVEGLR